MVRDSSRFHRFLSSKMKDLLPSIRACIKTNKRSEKNKRLFLKEFKHILQTEESSHNILIKHLIHIGDAFDCCRITGEHSKMEDLLACFCGKAPKNRILSRNQKYRNSNMSTKKSSNRTIFRPITIYPIAGHHYTRNCNGYFQPYITQNHHIHSIFRYFWGFHSLEVPQGVIVPKLIFQYTLPAYVFHQESMLVKTQFSF